MTEQPVIKDEDAAHPVPSAWRPTLFEIVHALVHGDYSLAHNIPCVAPVPHVTAHAMRGLLATLTAERGLAGHLIAATLGHEDERTTMHSYAKPGAAAAGDRRRGLVLLKGGAR